MKYFLILSLFASGTHAFELTDKKADDAAVVKVKYKDSSRIDFESLLIEGERKKPEMSVVTGNLGEKDRGLMVYRTDFIDMISNDFGEVIE